MRILMIAVAFISVVAVAKKKRTPRIPNQVYIEKNANTYTVLEGDWLSSIALTYFGNKKDWDKIAKANPYIKNPDLIHPGDVISLEALSQMRDTASITEDLPTLVPFELRTSPKEIDLDEPLILAERTNIKIRVKHFILGDEEVLGEITGSQEERQFFLSGDKVFVKAKDFSKFNTGTRLSIGRLVGDLEERNVSKSLNLGELIELVGELEVLETGPKYVKCEIQSVYGKIQRDDKIVPLIPSVRLGDKIKPPGDLLMKIVMTDEVGAKLSSQGSLILLNKGSLQNVAPDQYYRVFSDYDPVKKDTKVVEPQSKGEVQIVYAGKSASIGFVAKASAPIQLGDALVPYQLFSDPKPLPRKEIQTIEIN